MQIKHIESRIERKGHMFVVGFCVVFLAIEINTIDGVDAIDTKIPSIVIVGRDDGVGTKKFLQRDSSGLYR